MKHRTYAMLLSLALSVSLLASCGPKTPAPDASSSVPDVSQSQPDESLPDESAPQGTLTLNAEEITLSVNQSETFQLDFLVDGSVPLDFPIFTSSDESVAAVDVTGLITAVGPGAAVITAELDGMTAQCAVTCEESAGQPMQPAPAPETKPEPKPEEKPSAGVDLADFLSTLQTNYESISYLSPVEDAMLEQYFAGLSGVDRKQTQIYTNFMGFVTSEIAVIEVSDSKDVDTVKDILQARVDYMAGDGDEPGGAWYPGPTEQWVNNARVVSNGNFVLLVVGENCDQIVDDFNALF